MRINLLGIRHSFRQNSAVLPVWFALRTAAGCWSRTGRAERQQGHLWRPVSRCASLRAMPVAAANGIEINYTDSGGQGPAVVFSHGYLMDHTMFDRSGPAVLRAFAL